MNGDWKVYDVVIEDISLVNNYRAQFNQSPQEDLVNGMREKPSARLRQKAKEENVHNTVSTTRWRDREFNAARPIRGSTCRYSTGIGDLRR